jgi:hypothetical protein
MRCLESYLPVKRQYLSTMTVALAFIAALILLCPSPSAADGEDISRDLANPFSSLWSIGNQINFNQLKGGTFRDSQTQFNWNFQPVMPVPFNGYFNLINRMVIPYYNTPLMDFAADLRFVPGVGGFQRPVIGLSGDLGYASGIGDIIWASLISPNKAEGIIYGLGVTIQAPTASSAMIGSGLWQAGPAAGLFYVSKQFIAGLFPQHWHSLGGTDNQHPATRFTNLQYAVAYLPTPELTISSSANILIDWTKDEANRWTVPLAIGASYLVHLGKLPVQIGVSYQWVVRHPVDIEHQDSIVRLTFTPVIPSPFAKKE